MLITFVVRNGMYPMSPDEQIIKLLTNLIMVHYSHFFPSSYPDIPLNITMIRDVAAKASVDISEYKDDELIKLVEIKLAQSVTLNWNNYGSLALLLHELYPNEDLLALSEQKVIQYIKNLPNFNDPLTPDYELINSLIYTWMSMEDDESTDIQSSNWS